MDLITWLVGAFVATLLVGGAGFGLTTSAIASSPKPESPAPPGPN